MTDATGYLRALAGRLARAYAAHTRPVAILLTGSAAEGEADFASDLDLILYYDALPSDDAVVRARRSLGAGQARPLGPRTEDGYAESFMLGGVECQTAHTTVASWEGEMAGVLERLDVASPAQKALGGLLAGMPLHGDALIRAWQARASVYPDALARAMVEHYLHFFPLWYVGERLAARDATLWVYRELADAAFNILGVLAGLNRVYFSPFQFKRTRRFVVSLRLAPPDLYARLERLFAGDQPAAVRELEALVGEVVALVRRELPAVDVSRAGRWLGQRAQSWMPEAHG